MGESRTWWDWFYHAWFGHFFDAGEGWIYHAEHGWWYVADRDTADLFVYDTALATWGWTSKAGYPWIYWFYPRNVWTFYGRGGQPGERRFFSAMAGEWREEGALSGGGFIQAHDMIIVEGGVLSSSNDLVGTEMASFHIGRFEVTLWAIGREHRRGYSESPGERLSSAVGSRVGVCGARRQSKQRLYLCGKRRRE